MPSPKHSIEDEERSKGISPIDLSLQAFAQLLADLAKPGSGSEAGLAQYLIRIGEVLGADGGVLILLSEQAEDQALQISWSKPAGWQSQTIHLSENALLVRCLHTRQVQVDIRQTDHDQASSSLTTSQMYAPVFVDEKIWGAIQFEWGREIDFGAAQDLLQICTQILAQNLLARAEIEKLTENIRTLELRRQELFNSRNTLRALFDSTPTAIYIIDQQFNLKAINMSRANQAHQSPQALVGRPCYVGLYQLDQPCPDCLISTTFTKGEITRRTEHPVIGGENWKEIAISTYPINDESQKVVQAFIFEEDLTQQRQLENYLAQAEKLAAVGRLAAGVAHEINNPLTAVIANAQLLQRKLPKDELDLQDMASLILQAGNRASQAVSNLLDLARYERYKLVPVDVNTSIRNALDLVKHEIHAKSIQVTFDAQDNLPCVMASQEQLEGVWINLLVNAVDAIDHDHGEILLSSRLVDGTIQVYLEDNGQGISDEKLAHIFEPFYTTKEPGQGTGLGLSICHRVVEQLGGKISVKSGPDSGTQFIAILPVK